MHICNIDRFTDQRVNKTRVYSVFRVGYINGVQTEEKLFIVKNNNYDLNILIIKRRTDCDLESCTRGPSFYVLIRCQNPITWFSNVLWAIVHVFLNTVRNISHLPNMASESFSIAAIYACKKSKNLINKLYLKNDIRYRQNYKIAGDVFNWSTVKVVNGRTIMFILKGDISISHARTDACIHMHCLNCHIRGFYQGV